MQDIHTQRFLVVTLVPSYIIKDLVLSDTESVPLPKVDLKSSFSALIVVRQDDKEREKQDAKKQT